MHYPLLHIFFLFFIHLLIPSPKLKFAKNLLYNIKQWLQLWNFLLHACALYPLPCIHWGPKYSPDPSPSFNNPLIFGELTRTWKLHVPSRTFFSSSCHWCGFEHSGTWSFFFRKLSLFFNLSILYNLKTILKQHE